ncbi:hypothetical protein [Chitinophaga pinensis]|uniref:Uncharacterized protein n=1 Tax=Chitinophaga pinensis (strain ATCC 43595 / DSM 2588 / LMG 13176 / NBRC 15968 / NCIMB 11800 / UQM 2034) TaxID=485918 RepID=A0A979GQS1_CHIPD|nr:hypothetical protein [Chitinophaga pinensis]ACU57921.1 hypothetical protein Cpin_0423 [Chitinophaga pinensis DSM 2588]
MTEEQHLQTLSDIKRIMERSSRFLSLSGLSGVFAGASALAGAGTALVLFRAYYDRWEVRGHYDDADFSQLRLQLILLGFVVMFLAAAGGLYFTWRRAKKNNLPIYDATSRKVLINGMIPMAAGGAFIVGLMYNSMDVLVAPSCLIFYGMAVLNASKYTVSDTKYLGIAEIALGILNVFFLRRGLYFWAVGFGVMHIFYGIVMWWKYERNAVEE